MSTDEITPEQAEFARVHRVLEMTGRVLDDDSIRGRYSHNAANRIRALAEAKRDDLVAQGVTPPSEFKPKFSVARTPAETQPRFAEVKQQGPSIITVAVSLLGIVVLSVMMMPLLATLFHFLGIA